VHKLLGWAQKLRVFQQPPNCSTRQMISLGISEILNRVYVVLFVFPLAVAAPFEVYNSSSSKRKKYTGAHANAFLSLVNIDMIC
jgi:hypothetical protein